MMLPSLLLLSSSWTLQHGLSDSMAKAERSVIAMSAAPSAKLDRFNKMMQACCLPGSAIQCIDDSSMRTLLTGVSAAAAHEGVRRGFSIVYEDLGPARLAGDFIFRTLARAAAEGEERALELQGSTVAEGDRERQLTRARQIFELLDADGSGDIDLAELRQASPELLTLVRDDGEGKGDASWMDTDAMASRLMGVADENQDGVLSFVEFALAASRQQRLTLADETDEKIAALLEAREASAASGEASRREQRHAMSRAKMDARFDEMLAECAEWEATVCGDTDECRVGEGELKDETRMEKVLRGCFEGAKIPELVAALKLVYIDYAPLRLGGDLVYKLMAKVVNQRRKS